MSKRVYCIDESICDQSCNISDFNCKYYNMQWPIKENCGCPPNEHWGFNHDQRETICFFKDDNDNYTDEITFRVWKYGPEVTLAHDKESNHCEACARTMNHIAAQMIANNGGILDICGLKISYDKKGDMTMV